MLPATRRTTSRSLARCRLYSSPSTPVHAPALAAAAAAAPSDLPPFMHTAADEYTDMRAFLRRQQSYTILPAPLPDKDLSVLDDLYFPDTPMQDKISIIDACLHNTLDVPRAKEVFTRVRADPRMAGQLSTKLYNAVLAAYVAMAVRDPPHSEAWLDDATALYLAMESGADKIAPSSNTYALMLLLWLRVRDRHTGPVSALAVPLDPATLLRSLIDRGIPVALVVSDRAFTADADAVAVIKALSHAAVQMNLSKVILELGAAEALGTRDDLLADVPEVLPVLKQKTLPMEATLGPDGAVLDFQLPPTALHAHTEVPFNLATLRKHLANVILARRVLTEDHIARQKMLEESVYDVAVERLRRDAEALEELGRNNKLGHADLKVWMWNWHQRLQERLTAEVADLIQQEQKLVPARGRADETRLSPYVSLVSPEKLSLICILELMHLHGTGGIAEGMKTTRALLAVGKAVEIEYKAQMCRRNHISIPSTPEPRRRDRDFSVFSHLGYRDLHARRVAARKYMEDGEGWTAPWSQGIRVRVGSFLVEALMDVAVVRRTAADRRTGENVTEDQPAFYHSYEYVRGHKLGIIKLNPVVSERMANDSVRDTLHPRHLPMLVEPKRWISHDDGGYLYNKTFVMRCKDSQEQLSYLKEASLLGHLEMVYASLDVLGSTPWRINRAIFDVVLQVWNSGERLGKIPPVACDHPEPSKPDNYDTDPKARSVFVARHKTYLAAKANNHSDRCNTNYKIEIARTFLADTFYLPHNVDFRGRAYPIPPHLNHLGDDLARGLLQFGEAKPLTERGLRWLKIHLANVYGYDKASFDERVLWVHANLDNIYDSAQHPLDGRGWWKRADDPWQCLATCKELHAALTSPDPAAFLSSLPVHQDGTCNGLQHYAALGGDAAGARQVNLGVTDRPSDVYTHVAEMVERQLAVDAEKGEKYAAMLKGKVSRKVVKQTVMTTVYGVTYVGAREQIEKRLEEREDIPSEEAWTAAAYLAKQVLSCIGDLFKGAKGIQTWLNTSARMITKSIPPARLAHTTPKTIRREQMTSVIWTTPLGLPIVQPYRAVKRKQVMTALQTVFISDPNCPSSVNSMKQASAFPPNFIHSLDATHMMLTALKCKELGVTFASVHDSYWTHAASVDDMSVVIRDTFIHLHSSDILQQLETEFRTRYKDHKVPISSLTKEQQARVRETMPRLSRKGARAAKASASELESTPEPGSADAGVSVAPDSDSTPAGPEAESASPETGTPTEANDRYINLVDLLPPLPQKGGFDVSTIKKSLYFFS